MKKLFLTILLTSSFAGASDRKTEVAPVPETSMIFPDVETNNCYDNLVPTDLIPAHVLQAYIRARDCRMCRAKQNPPALRMPNTQQ